MEMILESVVFVLFVRLNFFLDCFDCSDKYHVTKINRKGIDLPTLITVHL